MMDFSLCWTQSDQQIVFPASSSRQSLTQLELAAFSKHYSSPLTLILLTSTLDITCRERITAFCRAVCILRSVSDD